MKLTKNRFLKGFLAVTMVLAVVRCVFPSVAGRMDNVAKTVDSLTVDTVAGEVLFSDDTLAVDTAVTAGMLQAGDSMSYQDEPTEQPLIADNPFFNGKHPIFGVRSYKEEFPDTNAVQLVAAQRFGVEPVLNRDDAEARKDELVYVGSNPYYYVNDLTASIPYLVPRAAALLQDIGRNFFDSLQVKHVPLHKIKVTSVLRTKEDVERLRRYNRNATENSCHLYGTTFDIGYNKYLTVSDPQGLPRREVRNDTLKFILSEVLRDLRQQNRCYVKYEVKQGCFHITTR